MQIKILLISILMSTVCMADSLSSQFEQCSTSKIASKLFIYKIHQNIKKDKKILEDSGLDGSIARTLGAFILKPVDVTPGYDVCLSRLYETFGNEDQVKKAEAFNDWMNCLPESESIKKEVTKLKKCFKID